MALLATWLLVHGCGPSGRVLCLHGAIGGVSSKIIRSAACAEAKERYFFFVCYSATSRACAFVFVCARHRFLSMTIAVRNTASAALFVGGLLAVFGRACLLLAFLAPTSLSAFSHRRNDARMMLPSSSTSLLSLSSLPFVVAACFSAFARAEKTLPPRTAAVSCISSHEKRGTTITAPVDILAFVCRRPPAPPSSLLFSLPLHLFRLPLARKQAKTALSALRKPSERSGCWALTHQPRHIILQQVERDAGDCEAAALVGRRK